MHMGLSDRWSFSRHGRDPMFLISSNWKTKRTRRVDQRVELGEAGQLLQLVAGQAQSLDVAQAGVSGLQDPQAVVGQIHVDQIVQVLQHTAVGPVKVTSQAERWFCGARLTTESSMAAMPLWLMSSVVRLPHRGMTAVTGQPDSAPSASHWENSLDSGTRIAWRRPEKIHTHTRISTRHGLRTHCRDASVVSLHSTRLCLVKCDHEVRVRPGYVLERQTGAQTDGYLYLEEGLEDGQVEGEAALLDVTGSYWASGPRHLTNTNTPTRGFGQAQLLGDGVELQRAEGEHLAGLQQLLACSATTTTTTLSYSRQRAFGRMDTSCGDQGEMELELKRLQHTISPSAN
ncbi:hypothetical protein EYF80_029078 [Liparis tanakae]|uniref:Uncharacterized protein n=1 Tax=Liparis tanakae TaxID=230148 RepID=A0A4Z2H7D0_9TELE|nr:hypothetical protein EYF80_029078 [Liparis tanakae]